MVFDPQNTAGTAHRYFGATSPPTRLGAGVGGYVYLSPDLRTAVKIHNHEDGFHRELEVYRRLQKLDITRIHGLTIPKLRAASEDLLLIQMDFVSAPYLLDFAGVLFQPPHTVFDDERIQYWHDKIKEFFGPNAHIAYAVYNTLAKHGLYYMDFRPTNLNLTGLPGLEPYDQADTDTDTY
jgi:hypothetical protein